MLHGHRSARRACGRGVHGPGQGRAGGRAGEFTARRKRRRTLAGSRGASSSQRSPRLWRRRQTCPVVEPNHAFLLLAPVCCHVFCCHACVNMTSCQRFTRNGEENVGGGRRQMNEGGRRRKKRREVAGQSAAMVPPLSASAPNPASARPPCGWCPAAALLAMVPAGGDQSRSRPTHSHPPSGRWAGAGGSHLRPSSRAGGRYGVSSGRRRELRF